MDNRERRVEFFRKFKNMEGGRDSDFVLQTNSHYSYISRKIFQGKEKYYASNSGAYDSFKEAFTSFSQGERWYLDLCEKVDPAYRAYVLAELSRRLAAHRLHHRRHPGTLLHVRRSPGGGADRHHYFRRLRTQNGGLRLGLRRGARPAGFVPTAGNWRGPCRRMRCTTGGIFSGMSINF